MSDVPSVGAAVAAATATPPAAPTPAAATPAVAEPPKGPPKAADWAALSARDRAHQASRDKIKADRESLERDRAAYEATRSTAPKGVTKEALAERVAAGESPLTVLAEMGLSYADLTKAALAGAKKDPAAVTKKLVDEALAEERQKREESTRADQERQHAEAWQQIYADVATLAKDGGEAYELIGVELDLDRDTVHRAFREMDEFDRQQRQLPPDKRLPGYQLLTGLPDAAGRYEAYLVSITQRRAGVSKLKPKSEQLSDASGAPAHSATSPAVPAQSGQTASAGGPRTLTQAHAQTRAVQSTVQPTAAPTRSSDPVERIKAKQAEDGERMRKATELMRALNKS